MRKRTVLSLIVAAMCAAWALAEDKIPLSVLPKSPEMELALQAYLAATDIQLLAEVSIKHTGDFTLGVDVSGIGKKGETIQQMELKHLNGRVHGLVLVNVRTNSAYVVFPRKP
jgi:hypothetical protein